jgi:hypothetical protein
MDLLKKTKRLLRKAFPPPAKIQLEGEGGISGEITSARFRGVDFRQRQRMLAEALREELTPEERKNVVIILTFTPEEQRFREAIGAATNGK